MQIQYATTFTSWGQHRKYEVQATYSTMVKSKHSIRGPTINLKQVEVSAEEFKVLVEYLDCKGLGEVGSALFM